MTSYEEPEPKLKDLLTDFGPPRKNIRPQYPFIRLANDRILQFSKPALINTSKDYNRKFLLDEHIAAGFTPEVETALK